jgi:hypothetical protein
MNIYYNTCAAAASCGTGGYTSWIFVDNFDGAAGATSGAYSTRSVAWPTTVYVEVYELTGTATCGAYTLSVARWSAPLDLRVSKVERAPSLTHVNARWGAVSACNQWLPGGHTRPKRAAWAGVTVCRRTASALR